MTDRAKRFRANHPAVRPPLEVCGYCGAGGRIEVEHIDGNEGNAAPANLIGACRSCNTSKGLALAAWGIGKKTRQYNPARPLATLAAYRANAAVLLGDEFGDVRQAVRRLQATTPAARLRFARQLGRRRNPGKRGGPSFAQWAAAMAAYGGGDQMSLFDEESARKVLHEARRAGLTGEYQRRVWAIRKERYGPSGRPGYDVPF